MKDNLFIYKKGDTCEVEEKPFIFELAMEGYLVDNPNVLSNRRLSLNDPEVKGVELPLHSKNRLDVLLQYANDTLAVVELKNVKVDINALNQLLNYLGEMKCNFFNEDKKDCVNQDMPIGILVGPELDENVIKVISNGTSTYTIYGIELKRFYNDGNWFVFTKWYYPPQATYKKDYTKYVLNGNVNKPLGKGRLVFEVIKDYISNHPLITSVDLRRVFPDFRKGAKLHVVDLESNVGIKDRYSRYFKETLTCSDGDVVVSSQWGIGNIGLFIELAKELGYNVKTL